MATNIEKLLIVQDRDLKAAKLEREMKDLPVRQKEKESGLKTTQELLNSVHLDLNKKVTESKRLEGEIDGLKQRITKYREQQLQIKNNTEYKALEHEIVGVQKQIRELEDRELAVMEAIEDDRKLVPGCESSIEDAKSRVDAAVGVLNQRMAAIEADLAQVKSDRASAAAGVEPSWLHRYDRIFQKLGTAAVVPVEHGTCGGCHMKLPPSVVHGAKSAMGITVCNFCGRMLYSAL